MRARLAVVAVLAVVLPAGACVTDRDDPSSTAVGSDGEPAPAPLEGVRIDLELTWEPRALVATVTAVNEREDAIGIRPVDQAGAERDGTTYRLLATYAPSPGGDEGSSSGGLVTIEPGATRTFDPLELFAPGDDSTAIEVCLDGAPIPAESAGPSLGGVGRVCSGPVTVPPQE